MILFGMINKNQNFQILLIVNKAYPILVSRCYIETQTLTNSLYHMKILHLSDTHGCHHRLRNLPEADVLVHSGDFTMTGTESEALDFLNWLCDLPYKHKIFMGIMTTAYMMQT